MVDLGGLLVDPDTPPQAGEVSRAGPVCGSASHPSMSATIGVRAREPLNPVGRYSRARAPFLFLFFERKLLLLPLVFATVA